MNSVVHTDVSAPNGPIAVVMISLNEAHNMRAVLENLQGFAQEVFLVDSYSCDDTVGIALEYGVHVVQRRFRDFGDQWNWALRELPITAPWTMKIDPDERLDDRLKESVQAAIQENTADGLIVERRLWFMGRVLPVKQKLLRIWRSHQCRFTDVAVNEHPVVSGHIVQVPGVLEHHDSPNLEHWFDKQNHYTSAEAKIMVTQSPLAGEPRLWGTSFQRRMWLKKHFYRVPFRYVLQFIYHYVGQGAWRAGTTGYIWARLRVDVMRMIAYKAKEMRLTQNFSYKRLYGNGAPDARVRQCE
jgi:glycosyltransferase involved in cell wall biosynthesis